MQTEARADGSPRLAAAAGGSGGGICNRVLRGLGALLGAN